MYLGEYQAMLTEICESFGSAANWHARSLIRTANGCNFLCCLNWNLASPLQNPSFLFLSVHFLFLIAYFSSSSFSNIGILLRLPLTPASPSPLAHLQVFNTSLLPLPLTLVPPHLPLWHFQQWYQTIDNTILSWQGNETLSWLRFQFLISMMLLVKHQDEEPAINENKITCESFMLHS